MIDYLLILKSEFFIVLTLFFDTLRQQSVPIPKFKLPLHHLHFHRFYGSILFHHFLQLLSHLQATLILISLWVNRFAFVNAFETPHLHPIILPLAVLVLTHLLTIPWELTSWINSWVLVADSRLTGFLAHLQHFPLVNHRMTPPCIQIPQTKPRHQAKLLPQSVHLLNESEVLPIHLLIETSADCVLHVKWLPKWQFHRHCNRFQGFQSADYASTSTCKWIYLHS